MDKEIWVLCSLLLFASTAAMAAEGHMDDDPLLLMGKLDELERHDADGNPLSWNAHIWLGTDLHKLYLKTEGERADGATESAEVQALYSRALAPYWDLQLGLRSNRHPDAGHDWAVIGLQGIAPYWFEIDAALFISDDSRTALRLEAEYEILFTQKLILSPEIEMNFHNKDDPELNIGSGLSEIEAGLRLRYEIRKEFAPYVGINWEKVYGGTAEYVRDAGEETGDSEWVVGIRAWF